MLQQQTNIGGRCPSVPVIQSQNKQGAQPFKSQQAVRSYKHNGGSYFSRSSHLISAADHRRPNFHPNWADKLAVNSNSCKIIGQNPSTDKLAVNNSYKVIRQNPRPVIDQSQNKQGAPPFKSQQEMRAKHNGGSFFSISSNLDHRRPDKLVVNSSYIKSVNQQRPQGWKFESSQDAKWKPPQNSFRKGKANLNAKSFNVTVVVDDCPTCAESFDPLEIKEPLCTKCRYQVCAFCYHRINSGDGDRRSPGCRTPCADNRDRLQTS